MSTTAWRLSGAFACYLLAILVCAIWYFSVYSTDRRAFAFNEDTLQQQSLAFRGAAKARLAEIYFQDAFFVEVIEGHTEGAHDYDRDSGYLLLDSGRRLDYDQQMSVNGAVVSIQTRFEFRDPSGRTSIAVAIADAPSDVFEIVMDLRARTLSEAETLIRRLDTIDSRHPDVWSFADFIYFSTMTQATGGYGDIRPNSTEVRLIAVGQVLVGLAILVIMVNVIVTGQTVAARRGG
jgi:hypothetical protein